MIKKCLFIACVSIMFFSCKKEEITRSTPAPSGILKFATYTEFDSTLKRVSNYTESERIAWEMSKGFKSFETECNEAYKKSNPENFASIEDLKNYVQKNQKYLYLIDEGNEEYTLETQSSALWYNKLLNSNQEFQVADQRIKVLKNATVSVNVADKDKLAMINESNVESYLNNKDMKVSLFSISNSRLEDVATNCGRGNLEWRADNGNDRTLVKLYTIENLSGTLRARQLVRPYKKTLGVWYYCTRTITFGFKPTFDYMVNNTWYREPQPMFWITRSDTKLEYYFDFTVFGLQDYHFGGYRCYGDTPSTPEINSTCGVY